MAQSAAPEIYRNDDEHGVDLVTGTLNRTLTEGAIGDAAEGIKLYRHWTKAGVTDNWSGELSVSGSSGSQVANLVFGNISEKFTQSGTAWVNVKANGATLTGDSDAGFTFKSSTGATIQYTPVKSYVTTGPISALLTTSWTGTCTDASKCALPTLVTDPDGSRYSLTWNVPSTCARDDGDQTPLDTNTTFTCYVSKRLTGVQSRSSYAVKFKYQSDTPPFSNPATQYQFSTRTEARFYDLSQVYCSGIADNCDSVAHVKAVTYSYPSSNVTQITDAQGGAWTFTTNSAQRLTAIRQPGSSSDTTTATYDSNLRVTSITDNGETKTYTWGTSGSNVVVSTSTGGGENGQHISDPTIQQPSYATNGTSNTIHYTYDANNRLTRETRPELDYTNYTRDARGNIIETRVVAKSGPSASDIVATANFDTTCTNVVTCNLPNYTIDPKGNRTDYTYDATHGGITRVQMPAASTGAARAQVDYTYDTLYPQVKDSSGALVNADAPEYKVTQITTCATAATCAGTANETKVTVAYNTPNLQISSITTASGDGALTATTAYTYDAADNLKTVDGPLSGSADTTTFFYDAYNRKVGAIGPDPDGSGGRNRQAERYTFDAESRVTRKERGSATAATDTALAAMTVADFTDITYDANGNVITVAAKSGTTTYAVTQYSYDLDNRLTCTAVRMTQSLFASLPSDACAASSSNPAYVPDRISKKYYDASGRVTKVQSAFGQTEQADEGIMTYTANSKLQTIKDAESNLTTYEYDDFDRLWKTRYPVTTAGSNSSSTTDYEKLTYDPNRNVTERRLRDGSTIAFDYDNLGRLKSRTPSGSSADTFQYDLLGHMTYMTGTATVTMSYDALGRQLDDTQLWGSASYKYDIAGRLTRLTWADGLYVTYDYDIAGNVTAIRENGATSGVGVLATYTYDDLGRRTGITRGNGTSTSYSFDAVSRLNSLTQNLAGTSDDQTIGSIDYNPASQIQSQVKSNASYAWTGHENANRDYTVNGLNQQTASGTTSLGYDGRGNLTSSGTSSYTYTPYNQMQTAPGSIVFGYDPAGRMTKYNVPGTPSRFTYAGSALIQESANGTITRRYVPGPGTDEPVVWYQGTGTSDRRWLHADERGSVIAVSDGSGAMLGINKYDEYGIPQDTNIGRFQYTGQVFLPDLGMYNYKARIYSPTLGRFMQTDPIGYGDGVNWYDYAGGDPVNATDPSGTFASCSLQNSGSTIYFRDYNNDGVPQVNEIVGITQDQTAVCTDDGGGMFNGGIGNGIAGGTSANATRQPSKPPVGPKRCPSSPKAFPVPKGYTPAFPGDSRFIRKIGSPLSSPPEMNPAYQKAVNTQNDNYNTSGFVTDLIVIAVSAVTGGYFADIAGAITTKQIVGAGAAAVGSGAAAAQEIAHKDGC